VPLGVGANVMGGSRHVSACLVAPAYTVRPARQTDVPFLYACYKRTMREYIEQTWRWDEEFQSEAFQQHLPWQRFIVIMVEGTPMGAACLLETPDHMVLEMMMIEPEYQSRRIGSDFVTRLLNHARSEGRGIKLRVMKINPARAMYERLGFVVVGEDADTYEMQAAIASQH
jgi:ribosomal protein S18 acetylase RimI-like enzyme